MKAMIMSDLLTMRETLVQMAGIMVIVCIALAIGMGSLVSAFAACATMMPLLFLFTMTAYDELNHWQSYRLVLPISRKQTVFGRYGSFLACVFFSAAISIAITLAIGVVATAINASDGLFAALTFAKSPLVVIFAALLMVVALDLIIGAVSIPFLMKYGMTRAVRMAPVVATFAFVALFALISYAGGGDAVVEFFAPLINAVFVFGEEGNFLVASVIAIVAAAVVLVISLQISVKLYAKREF